MALMKCPDCGKMISDQAPACPSCGKPRTQSILSDDKTPSQQTDSKILKQKENDANMKRGCIGCLVIVVSSVLLSLVCDLDQSGSGNHSNQTESQRRISGSNYFGCTDRDYFSDIISAEAQGDRQASVNALNAGLASGTCTWFSNGEVVYITDMSGLGLIQIRREGETRKYWTVTEAVSGGH